MKVAIVGPVNTDNYFGGVAIFTEGLAEAFKMNGDDVEIITDYSNKRATYKGVEIKKTFDRNSRKNLLMPYRIRKEINKFKPDLIITSLEYGIINKKFKNLIPTIHYLHAFASVKRTKINNFFVTNVTRYISNNSDYVISNSGLTSVINSEIFNINSNEIINVGLGFDFIDKLESKDKVLTKGKKNIIFAGRLVKEKNVDIIIKAFIKLNREDVILNILGDGSDKKKLMELSKGHKNIIFHGKIDSTDVVKYYLDADVFISLNPHEPYGIVYLEALASNNVIVCPRTGGQMDTLLDYEERVRLINPYDIEDISNKLDQALEIKVNRLSRDFIIDRFSYKNIAIEIKDIYEKKLKY